MTRYTATAIVNKGICVGMRDLSLISDIVKRYPEHDVRITIGGTMVNPRNIFSLSRLLNEFPAAGKQVEIEVDSGKGGYEKLADELKRYFENGRKGDA